MERSANNVLTVRHFGIPFERKVQKVKKAILGTSYNRISALISLFSMFGRTEIAVAGR
jgi:hypothetical protein